MKMQCYDYICNMRNNDFQELKISDLHRMFPSIVNDELAEDFFISRINGDDNLDMLRPPCRFDGYVIFFCVKGNLSVNINLRSFIVRENSLIFYVPGNIVQFDDFKGMECVLVAASSNLISSLRFDFGKLYDNSLMALENPCIYLDEDEFKMCSKYYDLTSSLLTSKQHYLRDSLMCLGSSLFYYLGNVWKDRIVKADGETNGSLRTKIVFESFMKLVLEHHNSERSIAFYANKLCLSPKYLSQLVKKVSGKSAPEWIDSFVVLEAKNLLKYSDMGIKEISYKLNFNSPAIFYRFFKAHTGLTPMEYRRG